MDFFTCFMLMPTQNNSSLSLNANITFCVALLRVGAINHSPPPVFCTKGLKISKLCNFVAQCCPTKPAAPCGAVGFVYD